MKILISVHATRGDKFAILSVLKIITINIRSVSYDSVNAIFNKTFAKKINRVLSA